ncbi:MAG: hypothetical protein GOMPHAMPRED_005771 [Gomphillus americanus]|uniref:Uncharacterized protein n=1 Tax=Gomphillus americanus TaxID=1940652 RepID=A0A8H3FUE2_9LECA|nr:MAG: hypothetical protein GOMPHAMPRED_005771 [Gomphillus americanus]
MPAEWPISEKGIERPRINFRFEELPDEFESEPEVELEEVVVGEEPPAELDELVAAFVELEIGEVDVDEEGDEVEEVEEEEAAAAAGEEEVDNEDDEDDVEEEEVELDETDGTGILAVVDPALFTSAI